MKYVVLIYSNPTNWVHPLFLQQEKALTPTDRDRQVHEFVSLLQEISGSGELVDSAALGDPATAKTIRSRDDVLVATDGPFADVKEHLAGFFVLDCESLERAVEIGGRFPDVYGGAVEVRPVADLSEMTF